MRSQWIGVFLIATIGPCFAEPGHVGDLSSQVRQGSTNQIDRSLEIARDAFEAATVQREADPRTATLPVNIARWLSATLGTPAIEQQPTIEFVSPAELSALRFNGSPTKRTSQAEVAKDRGVPANREEDLVALYEDATQTIYLRAGWTGTSPAELSVLVHEMVHHLQNLAGLTYECAEAREKPAYVAQQRWLELFGRSLEDEFSIDPMTLLLRTTCMM